MNLANQRNTRWVRSLGFVAMYVLLDRISYIEPLFGLNITPWNPPPALGLVYWLLFGIEAAVPWLVSLLLSEYLARGGPEGLLVTLTVSTCLVIGYGAIGEALRKFFPRSEIFHNQKLLLIWLGVVVLGTLINSLAYISLLYWLGYIPEGHWNEGFSTFWIGDLVGIIVSMPLFWLLASKKGRAELAATLFQTETVAYIALSLALLFIVFGPWQTSLIKHFYFFFVPLIWAATRQGVAGASLEMFTFQVAFLLIGKVLFAATMPIDEIQMRGAVLGTATLFMAVVVAEHREVSRRLKETIRLASAGEMAAALAHELNQPMTALSAYARACEQLLARGETGDLLKKAIQQMIAEANRATEVVRRLRDFFRSGAMQLESIDLKTMVQRAVQPYTQRAERQQTSIQVQDIPGVSLLVDPLQIEVILHNLLTNALESVSTSTGPAGSITVTGDIIAGHRVRLTVEDSGPGVSAALSERLFESFSSTKPTGLGLGLVVSKAIAEAHGGNLWVEPAERGIFRLVLPIAEQGSYARK